MLGKTAKDMTDEQVEVLVEHTHALAVLALDVAREKLAKETPTKLNPQMDGTKV